MCARKNIWNYTARKQLLCVLMVLLSSNLLWGQRYPFYNLNVENGLIQSQATSLTQDRSGNLWIGTIGGISRYDGKNISNYMVRNGLLNNLVDAIAADREGNIWIGSPEGISKFNGKKFTNYVLPRDEKTSVSAVRDIVFGNGDTTWCRFSNKVYCISGGKKEQVPLPDAEALVTAILADNGNLWVAKDGNLIYHYHDKRWDSLSIPSQQRITVYKLIKGHEGKIWLATSSGLYKIDCGVVSPHFVNGKPLNELPPLLCMTQDSSGAFWMGTGNGVIHVSEHAITYYNKHNGLSDNLFHDVFTDREGNVWLASDGQGLFRYSGMQFTGLDESMGLPSAQIMGIASDRSGRIFLGTYDAGLYAFADGKVTPIPFPVKPTPRITTMCSTNDGTIWIGTRSNGLWHYNGTLKPYVNKRSHLPTYGITSFYPESSQKLWIGFSLGAVLLDHDTIKPIPINNIRVSDFLKLGDDSILLSTDKGLRIYHAGTISTYQTGTAADSFIPECVAFSRGKLWIGTSDNGVVCYDPANKKSILVNTSNGLQSDFVYNICTDNENNTWVGTGYGIHKIYLKPNGEPVVTFYGTGQGIAGMESNHKSVAKMHDGSLWFGTTNGALHYIPHSDNIRPKPISIVLQSVKLFGENITDTTYFDSTDAWYGVPYHLQLPYRKNNISFIFHAVTLSAGAQLQYRYRIDGLDAPWSAWSANNSVTYSALPPGYYTFRAECRIAGDENKARELSYPFEIITPFQKTRWFRLLVLGACILLGISMQYIVNQRKQRREAFLAKLRAEEQAKIRMRTAEDFHDEVGNKITRINVLTNVLKSKIGDVGPDIKRLFSQIEDNTGQLYSGTQDILWSLTPTNDNLYEILHRIRDFGGQLFEDTDTEFIFSGNDEKLRQFRLPLDISRNLIMIFKEALNNSLKYSKASKVKLEANLKGKDILQLVLSDNGVGFELQTVKQGHGINNINVRAQRINGRLYIDSKTGKGTMITLSFKIPSKRG